MHEPRLEDEDGLQTSWRISVVILSTADFRSPVWTNKQHLAWGLAESGVDVYYIESLGLRQPTLSRHDIARVFRKLGNALSGNFTPTAAMELPRNLHIISPIVLPFHRFRIVRALNRALMRMNVLVRLPLEAESVLWTFSPFTYGLEHTCMKVVYHSVDLLHTIPGVPAEALLSAEKELLARADVVVASSSGVLRHLETSTTKPLLLWENVASSELFSDSIGPRKHRAIFAGNLTPTKINLSLLQKLVDSEIHVALAGPVGIDGSNDYADWDHLLQSPYVDFLGNLSLRELAVEVGRSKVGIIPYLKNDYTRGVFPMKVFEYLSGGLDVVATEIESLLGSTIPGLRIVHDDDFAASVQKALNSFDENAAKERSRFASSKSWRNRINEANQLLRVLVKGEQ